MKLPKILFIIPSLEIGGSERVLTTLLQNISPGKFNSSLCVLKGPGDFFEQVPSHVEKVNLKVSRVRFAFFSLYRYIRKCNPDFVFVFDVNNISLVVAALTFFLPSRIKYLTRESAVLSTFINNYQSMKRLRSIAYILAFKRFEKIICQSFYMQLDLVANYNVKPEKVIVINNPIDVDRIRLLSLESDLINTDYLSILVIGRIVRDKGYDLLIEALSKVKIKDYKVIILGDETPENPGYYEQIIDLINRKGINEKIIFHGFEKNPYKYIRQSDVLVVSSRSEAFSNVAIESNSLGLPVIAFNCPGGMSEIIIDNFNGWLVEDGNTEQLANKIEGFSKEKFSSQDIIKYTIDKYHLKRIIPLYENEILTLL